MSNVLLCTDSVSAQYPEALGLDGEPLFSQQWLTVLSSGEQARIAVKNTSPEEIWVAGSDDIDAINLAAAIKHDGAPGKVCLLAFQGNGSLRSRALSANIDEVWDKQAFLLHYNQTKGKHCAIAPIEDLRRTSSDRVPSPVQALEKGHLLSVVGAGGGVGKSSIAVIAAYLAQSKGYKTVLVDADLQFGDIQYLTGREDTLPLNELNDNPARLDSLATNKRHPAIISAPVRVEQSEELASFVPGLIEMLQQRFDCVVVNTAPMWTDLHLQLLEAGGNTLFILDQRPSSIRACKHALQLCARCGIATQPIVFALNRCSRHSLFSSIDVTCALQGAHVVELADGGRDVEELLGTGAPLELIDSGNALCQSVARLLGDLLPSMSRQSVPQIAIPSKRRMRFGARRKKAACL